MHSKYFVFYIYWAFIFSCYFSPTSFSDYEFHSSFPSFFVIVSCHLHLVMFLIAFSSSLFDSSVVNNPLVSREVVGIGEDSSTSCTKSFLEGNVIEDVSFPPSSVTPPTRIQWLSNLRLSNERFSPMRNRKVLGLPLSKGRGKISCLRS